MKEIITKVYEFDELNDKAKDVARSWYREGLFYFDWYEFIYEDANRIGLKITSFDLDRNRHAKGQLLHNTEIVAANILKEHGENTDTYKLAQEFLKDFNKEKDEEKREQMSEEFERALLEEYSIMLQKEADYMQSNESVDENIRINEYTFTEDGKRFG